MDVREVITALQQHAGLEELDLGGNPCMRLGSAKHLIVSKAASLPSPGLCFTEGRLDFDFFFPFAVSVDSAALGPASRLLLRSLRCPN